jgi:DNA polymerase-3 subunit delta
MGKRLDKARDFIRGVKQSDPAPLYFLYGEEAYMLDRAVEAVIDTAAPDGTNDFNYDKFQGREATGQTIREAAEMLPMMADRRIVLVRDIQEMALSELNELEDYFESPSETTCLILHAHTAGDRNSIDGRRSIFRTLKSNAEVCEFESLYENEVGDVVRKHASQRGLKMDREASAYLIEAVGTDIATLNRALDKIDLFIGQGDDPRPVERQQVEAVTAETRVRSVFDLTDALGERAYKEALKILDNMLLSGEDAIPILYMIARHFRLVDRLHDPEVRQQDKGSQASTLGVPYFFVDDYRRHARTFSSKDISTIRDRLLETDEALKSTGLDDRTLLESLLYDICFRHA